MRTFKKKNFESDYIPDEELEELVDKDGAPIAGDQARTSNSEIETGPTLGSDDSEEADKGISQYTDRFADQTKQNMRYPWFGSNYSSGKRAAIPESHKILAKEAMAGMIDEFLTSKGDSSDFVNRSSNQDVNRNKIPDITDITANNQVLASSVNELIKTINSVDDGEIIGILLNHLVSNMNTESIPQDYKRIITQNI